MGMNKHVFQALLCELIRHGGCAHTKDIFAGGNNPLYQDLDAIVQQEGFLPPTLRFFVCLEAAINVLTDSVRHSLDVPQDIYPRHLAGPLQFSRYCPNQIQTVP